MATITKLSIGLLASVIVLSSIAAAQLFVSDNNVAFAAPERDPCTSTDTEITCTEAGGGPLTGGEEGEVVGGFGFRQTCTTDISTSTEISTCTTSGGSGVKSGDEAGGGRTICTGDFSPDDDPTTDDETITCSFSEGSFTRP